MENVIVVPPHCYDCQFRTAGLKCTLFNESVSLGKSIYCDPIFTITIKGFINGKESCR